MATSGSSAEKRVVRVTSKHDIPQDAIQLTRNEAIELQWNLVLNWKPRRDAWPYTYGISSLGSLSGLSGLVINHQYRKKLNLLHIAPLTTFFPLVVVPIFLSATFHGYFIASEIMIGSYPCPLCMASRSAILQVAMGTMYPFMFAPMTTFYVAARTYRSAIPPVTDYKSLFRLYKRVNKRIGRKLFPLIALQAICGAAITRFEMNSIEKISDKLLAREEM